MDDGAAHSDRASSSKTGGALRVTYRYVTLTAALAFGAHLAFLPALGFLLRCGGPGRGFALGAFLALGLTLLLGGAFLRGGLLRRDLRALFRQRWRRFQK